MNILPRYTCAVFAAAIMLHGVCAWADKPTMQEEHTDLTTQTGGLPPAHQAGDITYITGGIGDEERDAMEAVQHDYNLHVTSANVSGAFSGNTHLVISDYHGHELLSANIGPLFYAQLPTGTYLLEATNRDETRKQQVSVGNGKDALAHFSWR